MGSGGLRNGLSGYGRTRTYEGPVGHAKGGGLMQDDVGEFNTPETGVAVDRLQAVAAGQLTPEDLEFLDSLIATSQTPQQAQTPDASTTSDGFSGGGGGSSDGGGAGGGFDDSVRPPEPGPADGPETLDSNPPDPAPDAN